MSNEGTIHKLAKLIVRLASLGFDDHAALEGFEAALFSNDEAAIEGAWLEASACYVRILDAKYEVVASSLEPLVRKQLYAADTTQFVHRPCRTGHIATFIGAGRSVHIRTGHWENFCDIEPISFERTCVIDEDKTVTLDEGKHVHVRKDGQVFRLLYVWPDHLDTVYVFDLW